MMKKLTLLLLCLTLIVYLPISVHAHSGDTDANGGHYDSETGAYHYHHGYPAHKHYDIDGDGYRDCPYDFDDKTGSDSGSSSSSGNANISRPSYSDGYAAGYGAGSEINAYEIRQKSYDEGYSAGLKKVPTWASWVIAILSISVIVLALTIKAKNRDLAAQKDRFEQKTILENNRIKSGIADLHFSLIQKYGDRYLYEISNTPEGDFVDDDLFPHNSNSLPGSLNDNYTYYLGTALGSSRARYHHRNCRYAKHIYPINAYDAQHGKEYTPCSICPCKSPDTSWVDHYRKHYVFLSEFVQISHDKTKALSPRKPSPGAEHPNTPDNSDIKVNWRNQ